MKAFYISLVMVMLAEFGDKTQFAVLALSTRFRARTVLLADVTGVLLVHILAVSMGAWVGHVIPPKVSRVLMGLIFILFGVLSFLMSKKPDSESYKAPAKFMFPAIAILFALSELGDKTMFATLALAANYSVIPVLIGSTLGLLIADGLAVVAGRTIGDRLPFRPIRIGSGSIYVAVGLAYLVFGG